HGKLVLGVIGIEKLSYTFTELKHLCVRPKWRGKKIGKFLVQRAMELGDSPILCTSIREDNEASLHLLKSLGFSESERYRSPDHSVVILTRESPKWAKIGQTSKPTSSEEIPWVKTLMDFTAR
ncbi:MAG: GNAT family N-acetyltransferase, partial [Nitrospira sp.]|nr:GNAT family N-acetyltransferase [Nitrospira sp.]